MRPFYSGETINLVVPTPEHARDSSWADWFNSQKTTQHTTHGLLPNTREAQQQFQQELSAGSRLALLITTKTSPEPVGIVSLSSIDLRRQTAAIAIIMDTEGEIPRSPFAALEAMAILTEHGFDVLGLRRIEAGQVFPALSRWNRMLELLGYRSEGFKRQAFRRGHSVSDEVVMGVLFEDFTELKDRRDGVFWPGSSTINAELKALPAEGFAEVLFRAIKRAEAEYFG